MALSHNCILLFVICTLISKQTHFVVGAANDWLAQAECSSAQVPETCMQCLNSDSLTANVENRAGIAAIVVGCVKSHSDNLVQEMTQLVASNHGQVSADQPLEECCRLLGCAKEEVIAAAQKIDKCDYEGADKCMDSAYAYAVQCHQKIDDACQKSGMQISEIVMSEMRVHEQLCDASMRILERCK
ncbi:hypothetical protein Vadar_033757 [Vaccinium darrowii]|uniref:Uncharacterized protein n=1 Tax=Vaccinium darrowii TaxID=229202 RepID=A0ACB7Y3Q1_9ERIC|nr:hypothetical protein Vadar_033757 [Vaccinium darrowii]